MFRFEKEQSVWDFNGTKIGGQPGEYPTVLGASIFYNKHEIVKNDHTGEIDKETAEGLWNRCLELTDITGHPVLHPDHRRVRRGVRELTLTGSRRSTTRRRS